MILGTFQVFIGHLVIFIFYFYLFFCRSSLHVLAMSLLSDICIAKIFFQMWLIFTFNSYILFYQLDMSSFNYFPIAGYLDYF